jgi:hypothetical protein
MRAFHILLPFLLTACASKAPPAAEDPSRDAWQKPASLIAAMEISPGMSVADIGAHNGYFEPHLSRAVGPSGRVQTLDIEARPVAANDPGLAPGSVDRILVVDTWDRIPSRVNYATRLVVGLKHGGQVFVVDFTREAQHGPPLAQRVAREEVARTLETAGLVVRDVDAGLPEQYVVAGTRP